MTPIRRCPVCHSLVPEQAKKCRHCHNYLGFSFQWVWEEGVRVLGLVAMVAAAVVAWKSLELTVIAQQQKDDALALVAISRGEHDALKQDLVSGALSLGRLPSEAVAAQAHSLRKASDGSTDVRVRQVLAEALKLQSQAVPFRLGGKSPEEGFDASGFVSYLLADVGALDPRYHGTFSVAKLEKSFQKIDPGVAKIGDLVFLDDNFVAFDLGGNLAVGIGGLKGIQVFSFSPKTKKSYHRWAYGQDARMLK
jgi:cell wall-associated NlpC family hydrolase